MMAGTERGPPSAGDRPGGLDCIGIWQGAKRCKALDPADRGLAYGDGLFETLRAHQGALPWWPRHRARLQAGAARLGFGLPDATVLETALAEALQRAPDGVLKLVLTRGAGARGYAPASDIAPTLLVFVGGCPEPAAGPLTVDLLPQRLAVQPVLAGLKHLNRLEQVLGAREAAGRGLDEGLMADAEGDITCGTRSNLVARVGGRWITPPVHRAGVAGIARGRLLEAWPALAEAALPIADLGRIEALFLLNAVRGILPAGRCGARALDPRPPGLDEARAVLAASHPAFRES